MKISKYFWGLSNRALKETEGILKDYSHPKFPARLVTLLSRCDRPRELFSLIPKGEFIRVWPKVRSYWLRIAQNLDSRTWWEAIYEQLLEGYSLIQKRAKGRPPTLFLKIGRVVREARLQRGLSQGELAFKIGMKQPDISMIERGKKNITLDTLARLCKALEIRELELE